jgi:hypothetical protein
MAPVSDAEILEDDCDPILQKYIAVEPSHTVSVIDENGNISEVLL